MNICRCIKVSITVQVVSSMPKYEYNDVYGTSGCDTKPRYKAVCVRRKEIVVRYIKENDCVSKSN